MIARGWLIAAGAALLVAITCFSTWKAQEWRYGKRLAEQAGAYQQDREQAATAVIAWQEAEKGRRQSLEGRLQVADETHFKELHDAQQVQARLRDRLATSDLRLSVLLAAPSSGGGVPASTGAGGLVHGAARGELDPAAAQRIVTIAGDGDEGIKALQACQAYVREIRI